MAAAFHLLAQDRVSDSDRAVSTDAALLCFAHDNVADFVCGPTPARHAVRDTPPYFARADLTMLAIDR
jgi:hypothetical protein